MYYAVASNKMLNIICDVNHQQNMNRWPFQEEFEDTNGAIRTRILKKNRQHNGQKEKVQKDKQRQTKHYTEN